MKKYFILFLLSFNVMADNYHHRTTETIINNVTSEGAALGIAVAQHHFDFGTKVWQGSVGAGYYDGNDAISFAIGKRFSRVLVNVSVTVEDEETGYGAGVNWRF